MSDKFNLAFDGVELAGIRTIQRKVDGVYLSYRRIGEQGQVCLSVVAEGGYVSADISLVDIAKFLINEAPDILVEARQK